jgi:hypothetical protein
MNPADPYYVRAIEFLALAENSSDLQERKALRELAFCWLRLSEHADEYWRQKQHNVAAA